MNGSCCLGDEECCCPKPKHRRVEIDFLYPDLNVCTRCIGTDANLEIKKFRGGRSQRLPPRSSLRLAYLVSVG